jgi:hypothetical protein
VVIVIIRSRIKAAEELAGGLSITAFGRAAPTAAKYNEAEKLALTMLAVGKPTVAQLIYNFTVDWPVTQGC